MGGPSSQGSSNTSTGPRAKETDKQQGTFFLGRYRVVDEIGVGGMASVHLARMDGPGGFQKWVAIKRIHPHLVEDDQFVDMFLDEARIAAGINHANVAQVFDLGKDDNTYWIAMEYLHGEPLREVMRRAEERRLRISPELAARICSDAAEGLHAAHELRGKNNQLLGLVHRDVTPHNLFLTYDGYTKVVDFGIAKVADRLSSTRAGTLKGKLAYMSPEQVRGAEVDRTTDIFALGVVLWELTTNQRLFRMDTDLDTLEKVQACVVQPPSTIIPDYPPELESVVMKALAKRKQDRFQTARELSRALQNFLMRRGAFVGPEEVAQFVVHVFADRIQKREAHLAWAAEVTSTINVDQLRAKGGDDASGLDADDSKRSRGQPARQQSAPASGVAPIGRSGAGAPDGVQMAATSLMDDDEDVPTTVATRDHLEGLPSAAERAGPRPAAGMSVQQPMGPPPQMQQQHPMGQPGGMPGRPAPGMMPGAGPGMPGRPGAGPGMPGAGPQGMPGRPGAGPQGMPGAPPGPQYPAAPYGARPGGGYQQQLQPQYNPMDGVPDERTAAFPSGGDDDLGATVALPSTVQRHVVDERARHGAPMPQQQPMGRQQPQGYPGAGAYAQPPFNGQGYGPPPQPYGAMGQPQQPQQMGYGPGGPVSAPTQAFPVPYPDAHGPQSQIETALSLPRPDPTALWLAQQDAAQRGQRKNTGVLVAVVALTALCVIGIGALVYFKMRAAPAVPAAAVAPEETAAVSAAPPPPEVPSAAPSVEVSAQPTATASARAPTTAATAQPTAPVNTAPTAASTAAKPTATTPAAAPTAVEEKEEPGFLTIVCTPACDDVLNGSRSMGPSPIVQVAAKPGQHRITLKRGTEKKVISVIVVSGQVTAQRVSMK